jgi:hypothetical protein
MTSFFCLWRARVLGQLIFLIYLTALPPPPPTFSSIQRLDSKEGVGGRGDGNGKREEMEGEEMAGRSKGEFWF